MGRLPLPLLLVLLLPAACGPKPADTDSAVPDAHGTWDEVDGLRVLRLQGTREELGHALGALTCAEMVDLFQVYVLDYLLADSGISYDLALTLVENGTLLTEGDERELRAVWEGALEACSEEDLWLDGAHLEEGAEDGRPIRYEDLLVANALGDWGCSSVTAWGAASATGETLHGRNFDWSIDPQGLFLASHLLAVYDSTEEGARWASLTVPGMIGCVTCITEEGVGLSMQNVFSVEASYGQAMPRTLVARQALAATAGSADPVAAQDAVYEASPQRIGNILHTYFPAPTDGSAAAAVFEYDEDTSHPDGRTTVRVPGGDPGLATANALAATNHYVARGGPLVDDMDTVDRLATLDAGLDAAAGSGGLDRDGALALLQAVSYAFTAHSILYDDASRTLEVFVSPAEGTPAPDTTPHVVDLDALFGGR